MSGIASGIGKVFSAVGSAAARVGSAFTGVGATTFTAGAAAAAPSMATGGLSGIVSSFTGGGVLGNIITGAVTQAGYGALIGGAVGAMTGQGFGKGALMGGLGGAVTGGLFGAAGVNPDPLTKGFGQSQQSGVVPVEGTATGAAPTGSTASAPLDYPSSRVAQANGDITGSVTPAASAVAAAPAAASGGGGLGKFLSSEAGGGLIAGVGRGLGAYMDSKQRAEEAEKDRQFLRDKEQRLQDSYSVDPSALNGPVAVDTTARPTPAQAYGRTRYEYDPAQGRIVSVPA